MIEEGFPLLGAVVEDMANPPWERASARVLIARLSRWKDIEQSGAHLLLFDEVRRSLPGAYIDFAFLPPAKARKALGGAGKSWFQGRASDRSPADFDLVMVSNSYALELLNLPQLFSTSGLPPEAAERASSEAAPIVVLGGSNASAAGALVVEDPAPGRPALASLVDGIFFGEGEGAAGPLAAILAAGEGVPAGPGGGTSPGGEGAGRPGPEERRRRLAAASAIPGFWPCLLAPGQPRARAPGRPQSLLSPLVLNGGQASTAKLTISSGCPGYCSFCLEGWDRSPYAEAGLERLLEEAGTLRRSTGASELEFNSFNFNTHGRLPELLFELNKIFRRVSPMSQRLDILADLRGLAAIETAAGKRSFTLGVEGVSAGMRAYYRKGLSEDQLARCLELCLRAKARELKLFFIVAGLETEADLAEFSGFAARLGALRLELSPSTKILVSAGFLVRLPFTPLQFAPLEFDAGKLEGLASRLKAACEAAGIEFRLAVEPAEAFVDQALSLLGAAVRPWLLGPAARGFVYEGSLPSRAWESLRPFVQGPQGGAQIAEKDEAFRPPLAFVEPESRHLVLRRHYEEARSRRDRPSCLGEACSGCGACSDAGEIAAMTGHRFSSSPPEPFARRLAALMASKDRFAPLWAAVRIPEDLAGADPAYLNSWLQRRLFALCPGLERLLFEVRGRLFSAGGNFGALFPGAAPWFGWEAFELLGPSPALLVDKIVKGCGISLVRPLEARPAPRRARLSFELGHVGAEAARSSLSAYLASRELGFTERRIGPEAWAFEVSPGDLGRRQIFAAEVEGMGSGASVRLELGGKAGLRALFEAFGRAGEGSPRAEVLGWDGLAVG